MKNSNPIVNKENNFETGGRSRRSIQPQIFSNFYRVRMVGSLLLLFLTVAAAFAQSTRSTDYSPDKTLKSNARVNPSTLAMEMNVPLGDFPGRAGNSLPVSFDYSSKLWQFKTDGLIPKPGGGTRTNLVPIYARRTAAGWSSSLATPQIDFQLEYYRGNDQEVNYEGQVWTLGETIQSAGAYDLFYIKRLHVNLPDGSSHEFRAQDAPINCGDTSSGCAGFDQTGTYLSVDGTKMRLEVGTSDATLFMPDGSRYLFGQNQGGSTGALATDYIDRNGNRMTYSQTNKQWTDTMGRVLTNPLPQNFDYQQAQTAGDQTVTLPGYNNGTTSITLSWRYLKDPNNGESGLSDTNQTLAYVSDKFCYAASATPISGTALFTNSDPDTRVCNTGGTTAPGPTFNPIVLTKITYPNGSTYQFKYNLYGEIEKIIYPSGGFERFAYSYLMPVSAAGGSYDQVNRGVTDRWVSPKGDGTDEQHWTYAVDPGSALSSTPYKVSTTAPDGTRTEQYLYDARESDGTRPYGYDIIKIGRSYEDRAYSAANQLLRRHLTKYDMTQTLVGQYTAGIPATRDLRPVKEISLMFEPNASLALAAMSETVYDANSDPAYFASLNPVQSKGYHFAAVSLSAAQSSDIETIAASFSSANLSKSAETDYLYDANYKARNIITLPTEMRVKDAAGNVQAKTQTAYDESAYSIISAGFDAQWTDPGTNYRGNPTTTRSWTDIAGNQFVETRAEFDNFGNLQKSWDAKGNVSETEYSSTYKYAYPTKVTTPVPDATGQNGLASAFETSMTYDLTTGLPLTTTDANAQVTTMEYNDPLLRPTKVIPPSSGGQTEMIYTDTPGAMAVKTRSQIDATNWAESTVYADGLGRPIKTQKKDVQGDVFTETKYDLIGRIAQVSNPYRTGDAVLWTQNTYDALSRLTKVKTPDNAEVNTAFDVATSGTLGTVVTVTDQAGKIRRSVTNALGQLARVDEPDEAGNLGAVASPNQATNYAYDTLNNLTQVVQGVQTRTFAYDSLSRLKNASNPESGAIAYQYDANGNLTNKTDARSISTTYGYDNLNRVKSRTYSDSTPAVSYFYDGTGLSGVPNYAKGKLTKVSSSVSETKYDSFDNVGKVLTNQQITDGNTYAFGYSYNLGGMLLEETYPSGRKVKNTIASDASLSKVETQVSGGNYATRADNFSYTAADAVSSMKLGNNRWETAQFNNRLQPMQLGLGSAQNQTDLWKVGYDYGTTDNNGNVKSQTITVPSINPLVQTYTYDSLNRLKSAQETSSGNQTWKQTFVYDRYGNRQFDAANTTTLGSCSTAQCNPAVDAANNRFTSGQGYTYDLSGNLITDANGRSFIYDGENKQKEVKDASNNSIGEYFYDGDGKRVKKISSAETTVFVYDGSGKLAAEYLLTSATPAAPTTSYLTMDNLGSPRVITDSSGNVTSRRDFMPFGEEISNLGGRSQAIGYQVDSVRQKFTGYERDNESDLDFAQARMYSNKLGRFTSVDPLMDSADIINPQTLNRYAYVGNNPINITDPTGEGWGEKDGYLKYFAGDPTDGYTSYASLVGQVNGQLVVLNAGAATYEFVTNNAAAIRTIAGYGVDAAVISASAGALGITAAEASVALAGVGTVGALAYIELNNPQLPQVSCIGASGCQAQAITDAINQIFGFKRNPLIEHNQLWMNNAVGDGDNPASNLQGETSPANPDPNENKPNTSVNKSTPQEIAKKRGGELVNQNADAGQGVGRSGGGGTRYIKAGNQLIQEANKLPKNDPLRAAMKTEGNRLINRGRSINHK